MENRNEKKGPRFSESFLVYFLADERKKTRKNFSLLEKLAISR